MTSMLSFNNSEKEFEEQLGNTVPIIIDQKKKCTVCTGESFTQLDNLLVCDACNTVIDEILCDTKVHRGKDSNDDYCSGTINSIIPEISTNTFIAGRRNGMLKKMHQWNNSSYIEKVALKNHSYLTEVCTRYNKIKALIAIGIKCTADMPNDEINKLISEHNVTYKKPNKSIINDAIINYKIINKYITSRIPIRIGIIAKCYYYACKEYYIIISNKELAKMFNISTEVVSKGNNKINGRIKKIPELRERFNKKSIRLDDILYRLTYHFEQLSQDHMEILQRIVRRIKNNVNTKRNDPRSILAGILNNCIKVHSFPLTTADLLKELYISSSTLSKYTKMYAPFVYIPFQI